MERANDVLFDGTEIFQLAGDRVKEETLHGTGCTFASAFTAQLAAGRSLFEAATLAKAYVTKAIERAIRSQGPRPPRSFLPPAHRAPRPRHPRSSPARHAPRRRTRRPLRIKRTCPQAATQFSAPSVSLRFVSYRL